MHRIGGRVGDMDERHVQAAVMASET